MPKKKREIRRARKISRQQPLADSRSLSVRVCEQIAEKGIYAILLLVPLTFLSNTYWPFDISKVTLLRILILITLGGYIGKVIASREWRIVKPPALAWWPVLIYLAIYAISTMFSMSPDLSLQSGEGRNLGLVSLAAMILLYFLVINIMTERRQLMRCLDFFLISSSVVALMGILQDYGTSVKIMSSMMGDRASAMFGNPDFLFAMMILAVPVSYGAMVKARQWVRQTIYFAASVILGWCILLSMPHLFGDNFSFLVALLIPSGLLTIAYIPRFLKERRHRRIGYSSLGALAILVLCLLIVFNAGGIQDNFKGWEKRFRGENTDRYMLAGIAWDSVKDHPVIGSGPNTFRNTFTQYATLKYAQHDPERREDKVHNSYVEAVATTGWLGLLTYTAMQIALFGYLLVWLLRNRKKTYYGFVLWLLIAGAVYMAHTAFMFHTTTPYTFFWILMAIAVSLTILDKPQIKTLRWRMSDNISNVGLVILGILICLSIYIAVRPLVANAYYFEAERRMNPRNPPSAIGAIPKYEEAINWNGSAIRYRWSYAIALLTETRLMDQAAKEEQCAYIREVINEAIEREPESGMLYYNRGIMMAQCGASNEEVLADVNKCIEMYPTGYMARQFRAQLNTSMGNLEQAIEDDEMALAVKPGNLQWMLRLGKNYISLGDQYADDDDPNTDPDEQYEKAIDVLSEAAEAHPNNTTAQYFLSIACEKAGQVEKAAEEYEQSITMLEQFVEEQPANAEGHYMLGFCYERTGDLEKAKEEYYAVLEVNPNHQQANAALDRLGEEVN
ncbi:MAG: tetratricopeptide repeat protein [Dehalococcoidia bacterium]